MAAIYSSAFGYMPVFYRIYGFNANSGQAALLAKSSIVHSQPDMGKGALKSMRRFLEQVGVKLEAGDHVES